jgi:2-keto-4-pentenoate hydratase/2-oxohepta-3-ene-1,7-dioic acid hydratase in catechol pathway
MSKDRVWSFTDGAEIPVGTLYCIGRNYAAHAREMGTVVVEDPIIFIKPPAAYMPDGCAIELPAFSDDVHHEVELVVVIGCDTDGVDPDRAWDVIAGVGIGLDLTARDVQAKAKSMGHPWAVAKSWKGSAPVSRIISTPSCGVGPWDVALTVNGDQRQSASTSEMERSVESLVSTVARIFTLRRGDAIFTGTPSGVGPIQSGDALSATLDGEELLRVSCQ